MVCELTVRNIFRNNLELYLEENVYTPIHYVYFN